MSRKAMELALDALENHTAIKHPQESEIRDKAIDALYAALESIDTLRDYFASQALAGGLEQGVEDDMHTNWWHDPHKIARRAYAIADAMLEVRDEE